jgi:hypothetical protein
MFAKFIRVPKHLCTSNVWAGVVRQIAKLQPKGAAVASLGIYTLTTGCSGILPVPPLEEQTTTEYAPISEVVKRVKCELIDAIAQQKKTAKIDPLTGKPHLDPLTGKPYLAWMDNWTAKVDVQLITNTQVGSNPGVAITNLLKNTYNTNIGPATLGGNTFPAIARKFNASLSGSYTSQAFRTEDVAFTLSIKEITKEFGDVDKTTRNTNRMAHYDDCNLSGLVGLNSSLGLAEWLNSALAPATDKVSGYPYLTAGRHKQGSVGPAPGKAAVPPLTKVPQPPQLTAALAAIKSDQPIALLFKDQNINTLVEKRNNFAERNLLNELPDDQKPEYYRLNKDVMALIRNPRGIPQNYWKNRYKTAERAADDALNSSDGQIHAYVESERAVANQACIPLLSEKDKQDVIKDTPEVIESKLKTYFMSVEKAAATAKEDIDKALKDVITKVGNSGDYDGAAIQIEILVSAINEAADALSHVGNKLEKYAKICDRPDGPLDSVSHQIQFAVTYSGSANATWTLTKIVAPGPASGALLSAIYVGTHTLTIVLAPANSAEASSKSAALSFNAALLRFQAPLPVPQ